MSHKPIRCPKCRSPKIKSGKFMGHMADEATKGGVHIAHAMHNPAIGVFAGAAWLIGKALDAANHEWCCEACKHAFSSIAGGCRACTSTSANLYTPHCCKTGVRLCVACFADYNSPANVICAFCTKPVVRK